MRVLAVIGSKAVAASPALSTVVVSTAGGDVTSFVATGSSMTIVAFPRIIC